MKTIVVDTNRLNQEVKGLISGSLAAEMLVASINCHKIAGL